MAARTRSEINEPEEPPADVCTNVSVCESCPGTAVFIEADNTDGWIASDTTLPITR